MKIGMKRAVSLALAAVSVLCLSSCSNSADSEEGGEHEPITISQFNKTITDEFLEALHEKYPEINLKVVNYDGGNGSGRLGCGILYDDMTDIFVTTQTFYPELHSERFVDLSSYDFVNNYFTFMLNNLDNDGGIYLLPSGYTLTGISYNKTLMQENGWEVPKSYNELMELVPKIEAAGLRPFACASDLDGYPFNFFFNLGNTVYFNTQDGVNWKNDFIKGEALTVGNEGFQAVADYYNEWIENGFITNEHTSEKDYMNNGDTVFYMSLGLSATHSEAENGKTYDFGIMPWLSKDGSSNMLTRSVKSYWGINKHLEEAGNEQKLQDAIHVMEFISTNEGQDALNSNGNFLVSPLTNSEIPEDSPYYELRDLVKKGYCVQLVYVGWENLVIPIAGDIRQLINGEITPDELAGIFDLTYKEVVQQGTKDSYGTLSERLNYDDTVKLCAYAVGKAADADCVLISAQKELGAELTNGRGVNWYLYEGSVSMERINIIKPKGKSISVAEMTGAQIKEIQAAGISSEKDTQGYQYSLFTKDGIELDDNTTYRLAMGTEDTDQSVREKLTPLEITPTDALVDYITELGSFSAEDIVWK